MVNEPAGIRAMFACAKLVTHAPTASALKVICRMFFVVFVTVVGSFEFSSWANAIELPWFWTVLTVLTLRG